MFFSHVAYAISDKDLTELAKQHTWQKLLHMDEETHRSMVDGKDFFLVEQGHEDAVAELGATVAMMDNVSDEKYLQTICKYPARFFWLSKQLNRPEIEQHIQQCRKLQRWVANNDEVSLILVSGYLGNPASTFGHALLKIQSSQQNKQNILMDTAINYGAITPKNESTLRYVYKGITGGYKATFLDKYYYTQELVYSQLESRDMWVYTLNLNEDKTKLLIYHVWELIGQKFDYYFLDENCAYQLADLLGLVIEEPMVEDVAWYVPVESFRRLEAIDNMYREQGRSKLIKSVTFIPSSQRKLNTILSKLNEKELDSMSKLMNEGSEVTVEHVIRSLTQNEKIHVLDAGLSYYNYLLIKSGLKPSLKAKALKQQILMARFRLPVSPKVESDMQQLASPTQGAAPILLGLGVGHSDVQSTYARLHWSGYHQSSTGDNSLNGDALVLLNLELGIGGKKNAIFLDKLDFIRIRKLNHNQMLIRNHGWAWQMRIGLDRQINQYDGVVAFGAGKTWSVDDTLAFYGMVDVSLHSLQSHLRLRPHLGMYSDLGQVKSLWYVGAENINNKQTYQWVWGGELSYFVASQTAVSLSYQRQETRKASLEARWFW
ncbi:MAG: DUF4105 domain-containing protein [Ghiorsea sp.]|nr:DUF4105 domain-containing protein [Ghiorsea sp.]